MTYPPFPFCRLLFTPSDIHLPCTSFCMLYPIGLCTRIVSLKNGIGWSDDADGSTENFLGSDLGSSYGPQRPVLSGEHPVLHVSKTFHGTLGSALSRRG
jgi:hypothetical protein